MVKMEKLEKLQRKRQYGLGRMLMVSRKDFVERVARGMRERDEELPSASATLLPFIEFQGTRSVEIARRMGVSKQAAAKAVKDLENYGLIMREPDETDARAFVIRFTPYGLSYMMKLHEAIDDVEADYAKLMGAGRIRAMREGLSLICYNDPSPDVDA